MIMKLNNKNTQGKGKKKGKSELGAAFDRLKRNRSAVIGAGLLGILILLAIFAPVLAPYNPTALDIAHKCQGPSLQHLFGTDDVGRDIFSRILYGAKYSLSLGTIATMLACAEGIILGAIAGFYGGHIDNLIMRLLDIIQAIPAMLLLICVSAVLGTGYFNTLLAMSVTQVPQYTRLLRASIMQVRGEDYVEAANAIGCSTFRQIVKYVFPNSYSPLLVSFTMNVGSTILSTASLSYIGLGLQPPTPEWGAMLAGAKSYVRTYPHMLIFPGLFIMITVLGLNMLGDAIRDALDPKLKD